MKFNNYSFPHPVLGREDDILDGAQYELTIDEDGAENSYQFSVIYSIDNIDIRDLVASRKAEFLTEISCTSTLFRHSVVTSDARQVFTIGKDAVRGRVECLFLVVASEPIPGYVNSAAHPELEGLSSDLDEGDVLAFVGRYRFMAESEFRKQKASSSFLEVIEGADQSGGMVVELDYPKIQIQLSKDDYMIYITPEVGRSKEYASLFQSAIAFPALVHALQQIVPSSTNSDFADKPWAQTLLTRIENEKIPFDEHTVVKSAQSLLGLPISRLLKETHKISATSYEDEEAG